MEEKITDCCSEPFIDESDVCSNCKEHAGISLATEYGEDGLPEGISIFDGVMPMPRKNSFKMECNTKNCKKKTVAIWGGKDYCEDCFEELKYPKGRKIARGPVY